MSALTNDIGFGLTTLVEAQRGMTDAEIQHLLLTGELPDLSTSPTSPDESLLNEDVLTDAEAEALLAGYLVASAGSDNFLAQAKSHSATTSFKFNPNQPRDGDGKWTDGLDTVNVPTIPTEQKGESLAGSKTTSGGSTKKAIPAVIYKKHGDGTVVAQSADGQRRMRWAAGPKKFVVDENKDGSWQETDTLNKTSAYNDLKSPDKWYEPGQELKTPIADIPTVTPANLTPGEMTVDQWRDALGADVNHPTNGLGISEDLTLKRMAQIAGFDKPAQYGDINNGGEIGYRGVSDPAFMDQLVIGDYFGSIGQYGNGTYFASKHDSVNVKHAAGANGVVFGVALSPDAKTITLDELENQMESDTSGLPELLAHDPGRYAIASGYDAYFVQKPDKPWRNMIVVNRSKLTVEKSNQNSQTGTNNEPSTSSQTPEPEVPVDQPVDETSTSVKSQLRSGNDLINSLGVDPSSLFEKSRQLGGDTKLANIVEMQPGWTDKPQLVSSEQLDDAVKSGWTELWRGINAHDSASLSADLIDQMKTGDWHMGIGFYGNGAYFSARRETAETHAGKLPVEDKWNLKNWSEDGQWRGTWTEMPGKMLRLALDPAAKIADYDELRQQYQKERDAGTPGVTDPVWSDIGRYAAMRGYDGLRVKNQDDGGVYPPVGGPNADQLVMFNRSALIMQDEDPVSVSKSTVTPIVNANASQTSSGGGS